MITVCKECGEEKEHYAKGLCVNCYHREYQKHLYHNSQKYRKKMVKKGNDWAKKNPEKVKEYNRKWRKNNRYCEARWQEVIRKHLGNKCEKCGSKSNLHIHHNVPLGKGGKDEMANLMPLCRKCHGYVHRLINFGL